MVSRWFILALNALDLPPVHECVLWDVPLVMALLTLLHHGGGVSQPFTNIYSQTFIKYLLCTGQQTDKSKKKQSWPLRNNPPSQEDIPLECDMCYDKRKHGLPTGTE